jgi:hypothetical protein
MDNIRLIIKDYKYDILGIGNILKCLISALSVNNDTVIQCYDDYMYGAYDTILDDKFIYKGQTDKELEKVYTCRFLIHKNEEDLQEDLPNEEWYLGGLDNPKFNNFFSFTKRIDWHYDTNKIHPIVKKRIFNNIDKIIFKPLITNIVNRTYNSFKDHKTLGLSIRTWKASHENNINRSYNFETYISKIDEVLNKHKDINKIVISIDNHQYIEQYLEYFKQRNIPCLILNKSELVNDIQYAIIKALILAKCNYFIGNRISTFSELVFWFSKHQTQVYPVF